ncbi:MAG: hypothetical protein AAFX06_00420 [Planctomycetota bacterium]
MHDEIPEFEQGPHRFRIVTSVSGMIRTLTLSVFAASEKPNKPFWVDIYRVTEGDHIWNTLVADRANENGDYDLMPAIRYLHDYAPRFSVEHPDALRFSSHKKAQRFSEKHLKAPVKVRGFPFPVKYPGT